MRKPGYYWAKHKSHDNEEVVHFNHSGCVTSTRYIGIYNEDGFEWISDNLIQPEKKPIKLINGRYYVISIDNTINTKPVNYVASYWEKEDKNPYFNCDSCCFYSPEKVKILAGPFTTEELINLKPIEK